MTERSTSRGREAFVKPSGRGGLGNICQASVSRDARPEGGPDDFSNSRGREPTVDSSRIFSTGRGGAGNVRPPNHAGGGPPVIDENELEVIRSHVAAGQDTLRTTGRGGLGNVSTRSRSRDPSGNMHSPSPARPVHSTGRGGAGNIVSGDGLENDVIENEERRKISFSGEGIHSTGRGGAANLTSTPGPGIEHHAHHNGEYESTGRGGAGNIFRERD